MKSIRELKAYAREAMSRRLGIMAGAGLLVFAITFAGTIMSIVLFPGMSLLEKILSELFSIIVTLIFSAVTAGYSYMVLQAARGREISVRDLGYFLKHHPDRVIVAASVTVGINVATSLPYMIYSLKPNPDPLTYSLLMFGGDLIYLILTLPMMLYEFTLSDDEEIGGVEGLKRSIALMKGQFWRYIGMSLSFVPWVLLSAFTMGLGFLWVFPYMLTTRAEFYRDLNGEFRNEIPALEMPYDGENRCTGIPSEDMENSDDQSEA